MIYAIPTAPSDPPTRLTPNDPTIAAARGRALELIVPAGHDLWESLQNWPATAVEWKVWVESLGGSPRTRC